MRILYLQNMRGETGPAKVDVKVIPHLDAKVRQVKSTNKLIKAIEILFKLLGCKVAIMSSLSNFNKLVIKLCKILKIKTIYFMHGCASQESVINNVTNEQKDIEEYTVTYSDKIICVSQKFADYVIANMHISPNKVSVVYNGLEIGENHSNGEFRDLSIITTGGSSPNKNNIKVCQAIELIASKYPTLTFSVVHNNVEGRQTIERYPFVKYLDTMPQIELFKLMAKHRIYIQNSTYETFGLAVAEGINQGCDVLLAKNIGIIDLIKMPVEYIINDNNDINEIAAKIEYIIAHPNNKLLMSNINKDTMSWKACADNIMKVVKNLE